MSRWHHRIELILACPTPYQKVNLGTFTTLLCFIDKGFRIFFCRRVQIAYAAVLPISIRVGNIYNRLPTEVRGQCEHYIPESRTCNVGAIYMSAGIGDI